MVYFPISVLSQFPFFSVRSLVPPILLPNFSFFSHFSIFSLFFSTYPRCPCAFFPFFFPFPLPCCFPQLFIIILMYSSHLIRHTFPFLIMFASFPFLIIYPNNPEKMSPTNSSHVCISYLRSAHGAKTYLLGLYLHCCWVCWQYFSVETKPYMEKLTGMLKKEKKK